MKEEKKDQPNQNIVQTANNSSNTQKDFMVAAMLSLFLGWFGADRFYLGKIGTGILKLITFGGYGLWYLIDLIIILAGGMRAKDNSELGNRQKNLKSALIITGIVFGLGFLLMVISSFSSPSKPTISTPQPTQKQSTESLPAPQKPAAVYDVPILITKNIDEIRAALGKPKDSSPEPTEAQKKLGVDEWDNEWSSGDYGLLVYFNPDTRKVREIFLTAIETTYIKDVDGFLGYYNLSQNDGKYSIKLVYENGHEGDKSKVIGISVKSK